jgi:hypothetical protein
VSDLVTISEDGVVVTPVPDSTCLLNLPETRKHGVETNESKYKELWETVRREYPSVISIAMLGEFMLITTEQEVQGKVSDTKSYIRELIQNLESRIKLNSDSTEHVVLSVRRDMLAGLL